jgi:hypothetical protein
MDGSCTRQPLIPAKKVLSTTPYQELHTNSGPAVALMDSVVNSQTNRQKVLFIRTYQSLPTTPPTCCVDSFRGDKKYYLRDSLLTSQDSNTSTFVMSLTGYKVGAGSISRTFHCIVLFPIPTIEAALPSHWSKSNEQPR